MYRVRDVGPEGVFRACPASGSIVVDALDQAHHCARCGGNIHQAAAAIRRGFTGCVQVPWCWDPILFPLGGTQVYRRAVIAHRRFVQGPGWVAHWHEMISNPFKIGRPRQLYTGPTLRDYPDE